GCLGGKTGALVAALQGRASELFALVRAGVVGSAVCYGDCCSVVCSSDFCCTRCHRCGSTAPENFVHCSHSAADTTRGTSRCLMKIGRASCRERVWILVSTSGVNTEIAVREQRRLSE